MKNRKAEIGTIVMMVLLVIVSLISFGSSNFLSKKQTVDTKAAVDCSNNNRYNCSSNFGVVNPNYCGGALACGNVGWGPADVCYRCVGPGCKSSAIQYPDNFALSDATPCCIEKPMSTRLCCTETMKASIKNYLGIDAVKISAFKTKATSYGLACVDELTGGGSTTPTAGPNATSTPVPNSCPSNVGSCISPGSCSNGTVSLSANNWCSHNYNSGDVCCKLVTPITNTPIPTQIPTPTPTYYPNQPTFTPAPTATKTPTPTKTPIPTKTPTPIKSPTPTLTITPTPTAAVTGECNNFTCSDNSSIKYSYKCANPNFGGCGGSWNFYTERNCSGNPSTFNSLESMTPIINSYCTSSLRSIHLNIILKAKNPIPFEPTKPQATFTVCYLTTVFDDMGSTQTQTICPVNKSFNLTEIDANGYNINENIRGPHELSWTLTFNPKGWDWQDTLSESLIESNGQIFGEIFIN